MLREFGRGIALACAAVVAAAALGSCVGGDDDVYAGGIRMHRVTLLESQRGVDGLDVRFEDWIVRSATVRVLVGGTSRPAEQRGAILAIRAPGLDDDEASVQVTPSVHLGKRRLPVRVDSIRALERDDRAILRIVGSVGPGGQTTLRYTREITLDRRTAGIGLRARLASATAHEGIRLGERLHLGGSETFVPGVGYVADETFRASGFVGIEGEDTGTVIARIDRPANVGVVFERHGTERLAQFTEFVDAPRALPANGSVTEHVVLAIASRGMSDALRLVGMLRGRPFAEARATLPYAPPNSLVRIRTLDGRLVLVARPSVQGTVRIPLPDFGDATTFVAAATARGHAGGSSVRFVAGDRIVLDIPRGGQIRVVAFDVTTGTAIPARVRFLPVRGSPAVDLGPDHAASGAKDAAILVDGRASVPMPKGTYRVLVTHGPEWTLHDETVEVTETFQPDVRGGLVRLIEPGNFVGCDLHVHASPSPDSRVTLTDRVRSLVAEGVEFAVPTDHNHVSDYAPAAAEVGMDARGFLTMTAVEATTWDPAFGHFNAYPAPLRSDLPDQGAPNALQTTPADLFQRLHELSPETLVQVNHPRSEGGIGYFDVESYDAATGVGSERFSDDFDALEVWNGFDLARADTFERVFADYVFMVARGLHVTAVGNSDSHQIRYQWAGYPRTYVETSAREPHAILEGIRLGRTFVSSGPFLEASIGEARPGGTARAEGGQVVLHVRVRTAPYVKIDRLVVYLGAEKVVDRPIPAPRRRRSSRAAPSADVFETDVRIPVARDSAVLVLVSGSEMLDDYFGRASIPPLAFTSPIWIDADGDGEGPRDPRVRPERHYADAGVAEAGIPPMRPRRDGAVVGADASEDEQAGPQDATTEPPPARDAPSPEAGAATPTERRDDVPEPRDE